MAAVFPLDTSQPWTNNGVTYEYDATEDRWYVVSTTATDQVVSDIADLNDEVDALELTVANNSTQFLTTTGGTINADGGSQSSSGNLIIQDKAAGGAGRLYVKDKDGNTNLSAYPSGALETNSTISLAGPNANKNLRCYGSAGSTLKILTGDTASSVGERLSISSTAVTVNTNLVNNFDYSGINIYAAGTVQAGNNLSVGTTSTLTGNVTTGADLTVGGDLTVTGTFNTSGPGDTFNSRVVIDAPLGNSQPGLAIKTTNNNSTLWNSTQPGTLQFQTTSGSNGGTCGIFVNGDSPSPSFTMAIGAPGYSLDQVFTYSYSATYGKRIYMYPNWGSSYANAATLPDATPVTLGYLRNQGLLTQAFTSVVPSNDPNDLDDTITTQTSVAVAAQMALDGRLTIGRGFTLRGCTVDQPVNTSAVCLQLYHPISAAAQLLYEGDTTGDAKCLQTKESVAAAITAESDKQLGATWLSQNQQSNVGSTLDGFFLLQYSKSSAGMVAIVVDAENSASISVGDTVGTLPEGYRPEYHKWPVFTLINSNQSITAQCVVLDDGRVRFISVNGASTKFFGQCVFSSNTL